MKLKVKAAVTIGLIKCGLFGMLFHMHINEEEDSKAVSFSASEHKNLQHGVLSLRNIGVPSSVRECTATRVMLPSADFTSYSIMKTMNFSVSESGMYKVVLPRSNSKELEQRKKMGRGATAEKLNVIVVPHSQNGPGPDKTFHEMYQSKSRHVLDRVVQKLKQYANMSFIWTETSVLSAWWGQQNDTIREQFKKLLKSGRLEVVNGGWVVPDEACTQYHTIIEQLILGHQWLYSTLGVRPRNNWAVGPFGHSGTLSYLWKLAGFDLMVVGQVHEAVRSYLRKDVKLETTWRQAWDAEGRTDIPCHVLPYRSSRTADSCGPDSNVCSRFDFAHSAPIAESLREDDPDFMVMAAALYEQYRLTSNAFLHNTIFVPVGGDYRWATDAEWDNHYKSYQKLFKYINSRADWNVSVRFGTMTDYYNSAKTKNIQTGSSTKVTFGSDSMPVFSGDFFPYSESGNAYWTGFYSSLSWIKFLSREVDTALRTANLLHVMACLQSPYDVGLQNACRLFGNNLKSARSHLALFQHYEAITGTSNPGVVEDYHKKLIEALRNTQAVSNWAVPIIMINDLSETIKMYPAARLPYVNTLRMQQSPAVRITQSTRFNVIFFNPLPVSRLETVSIRVNSPLISVSQNGADIPAQILPVLSQEMVVNSSIFDLTFSVTVPPLGLETVELYQDMNGMKRTTQLSQISIKTEASVFREPSQFRTKPLSGFREIVLENDCLKLEFDGRTGLIKEVLDKISGRETTVDIDFLNYTPYKGSAKVFQTRLNAESFTQSEKLNVLVSKGIHVSAVQVLHPIFQHTIKLYNTSGLHCHAIHIENVVKLGDMKNVELVMRIKTDLKNNGEIYTDSNGLQMVKREGRPKLPLAANIFPMTSMAFIQSRARRMTLHSFQPLAVSSIQDSSLDVLLDRTIAASGKVVGLKTAYPSPSRFYLTFEEAGEKATDHGQYALPTLLNYQLNDFLQSPLLALQYNHASGIHFRKTRSGLTHSLPCDLSLVSVRELPIYKNDIFNTAVILHRRAHRCGLPTKTLKCASDWNGVTFESVLSDFEPDSVGQWSLSYLEKLRNFSLNDTVKLSPMDIKSFHFRWTE